MNNLKVAISCESTLTLLIEEYLNIESINLKGSLLTLEALQKNNIDILIIDDKTENLKDILTSFKNIGVDIILMGYSVNSSDLRGYFKNQLIFDYVEKNNFILLKNIFKTYVKEQYKFDKILVSDSTSDILIDIYEICYINYDRENRRSIIWTNNKEFYSKKSLSEIEEILEPFKYFIRGERSVILNKKRIISLDYRDEKLAFDNGSSLYLSKKTLKNIRKELKEWNKFISF